jgi:hypothetical protein
MNDLLFRRRTLYVAAHSAVNLPAIRSASRQRDDSSLPDGTSFTRSQRATRNVSVIWASFDDTAVNTSLPRVTASLDPDADPMRPRASFIVSMICNAGKERLIPYRPSSGPQRCCPLKARL